MIHRSIGREGPSTLGRLLLLVGGLLVCCVFVTPANAGPILGTVDGCATTLPTQDGGRVVWTFSEHFQFVSFHDPKSGCDPTIAGPGTFYDYRDNYDGLGGLMTWS